jgi:hypothetical protein
MGVEVKLLSVLVSRQRSEQAERPWKFLEGFDTTAPRAMLLSKGWSWSGCHRQEELRGGIDLVEIDGQTEMVVIATEVSQLEIYDFLLVALVKKR